MKKSILSILTVLTVFALVMTGCPSPASPTPKVFTVTFDGNDNDSGEVPAPKTQPSEGEPITLPGKGSGAKELKKTGFTFSGWATTDDATTADVGAANAKYTPTGNITVYAVWTAGGGGGTTFTVTFNKNGGDTEASPATKTGGASGVGTLPTAPTKAGSTFKEWNTAADGTGTAFTATTPVTAAITVYAKWEAGGGGGPDLARAEKVGLANAFYAVYQFVLPTGKKWEDYKAIKASYMFTAEDLAAATSRNGRLMGNYVPLDFTLEESKNAADEDYPIAIASYNHGKNAEYILDGGQLANSGEAGSLVTELKTKLSIDAVGGEWFTIEYKIDGSTKNGSYVAANLPSAADTGPFYFGVGLPGAGATDLNTQYIRDVTLVGYDATIADVIATPLWLLKDSKYYPAFTGYPGSGTGANGVKDTSRKMVDNSQPTPVDMNPKPITITFNLNYPSAPAASTVSGSTLTPLGTAFPANPTRSGWGFSGWNSKADGTGSAITATTTWSANAEVFAQWAELIIITLDLNYTTAPQTTTVPIGKGAALGASLTTPDRSGYLFLGWNKAANGSGDAVTATTTFDAATTIYAKWVIKATVDSPVSSFVVTLLNAGGKDKASPTPNDMAVLSVKKVTITDAYVEGTNATTGATELQRQSGADAIRFDIDFALPANWQGYEKIVIDYEMSFAVSPNAPCGVGNQLKCQAFYGKNNTAGSNAINYFDFNATNDPPFELTIATIPDAVVSTLDGLTLKTNPYGFAAGKTMQGVITYEVKSITFKAYASE